MKTESTADVSELLSLGKVSRFAAKLEHQVSSRIMLSHIDYPKRIRNLNWQHAGSSRYVRKHLEHQYQ